jgi:hypothetical protein
VASPTHVARVADVRAFRVITTILALGTVVAAGGLGLIHDRLHLTHDDARTIASVLLVVGVVDTLILYFWERLFSKPSMQL